MNDDIRYSRMTDFLQLLYMMMAEPRGVTLDEIAEEFGVSRRTAERMRDAIRNEFSQVDVISEDNKVKRWGFINYSLNNIIEFTDEEIAAVQSLTYGLFKRIPEIDSALHKMKALRQKNIKKTF